MEAHWRWGLGFGFGGSGIKKQTDSPTLGLVTAEKSEGFGMLHLFAERTWGPRFLVGIEHSRGFRMGPFSAGVGFTSAILRWFYLGPAPELVYGDTEKTHLFVKRWSPYTGGTFGVAAGTIKREGDQVPEVSSSGVHFGLKNGIDYSYSQKMLWRWEISYQSTFFQDAVRPATMTEFSLWMGLIMPLF